MRTYLLNPRIDKGERYIREGRCMQKAASWATAWPPISLGVLAQIARDYGDIRLIDGNVEEWTLQDLLDDIRAFNPDLIMFNTAFPSIDKDMGVAEAVKNVFPGIKLIAFGVYFTLLEEKGFSQHPYLDFCINGEPEDTFREVLATLEGGRDNFDQIQGLIFRKGDVIQVNPGRPLQKDMDKIPFPARDLLKNERYRLPHNGNSYTLINVGRGCPYSCTYCVVASYSGKRVRKHSVNYVINEIKECKYKYGIQEFLFWDEVFTMDRGFALELCEAIIDQNLDIRWAASTRVDLVDYGLLLRMKEAGCYLLGMGIESGSQEILDRVKKEQSLDEIRHCIAIVKKAGIKTMGHFIFGLPGETRETAQQTIDFMLELGLDFMQGYCAVPYPKTAFGEMARENRWIEAERWSDYDFGGESIIENGTINAKDVVYFREKAFKKFYYRPSYIMNNVIREYPLRQLLRMSKFANWIATTKKSKEFND